MDESRRGGDDGRALAIRSNDMAKRDPASTSKEIVPVTADRGESPVAKAILEFVSRIPESEVPRASKGSAEEECRRLANSAANKAALTAGSLALPPGPLGWLTVLPELVAIWRIQGQLVSDIASAYGKTAKLGREQMLWCLFRHTAAQAFRDVAIRVGDRLVFRTTATSVLQRLAGRIGVSVSKRAVGKGISRWLPIVGALGVGAYAYYDTGQVAKTAIDLFSGEVHIDDGDTPPAGKKRPASKSSRPEVGADPVGDSKAKASARKAVKKAVSKKSATRKTAKKSAPRAATAKKTIARRKPAT
jgi:hypothetical protein